MVQNEYPVISWLYPASCDERKDPTDNGNTKIKQLGINVTINVQDTHEENCKTFLKATK